MRFRSIATVGLLAVATALVSTGTAQAAGANTYAAYSLMNAKAAGQYWSGGQVAGQWAWKPASDSHRISWGDPPHWPPPSDERFVHVGSWVYLAGYDDGSTFNRQVVTREQIGDGNCHAMKTIPSHKGMQHYTKWTVGSAAYCLRAWGVIHTAGGDVHFYHGQVWSPPASCTTAYLGKHTCIRQHERWADDNGHAMRTVLIRDQYIARGIGMAFAIRQSYPISWSADLRYHWTYT
jgi:hypothetical protein